MLGPGVDLDCSCHEWEELNLDRKSAEQEVRQSDLLTGDRPLVPPGRERELLDMKLNMAVCDSTHNKMQVELS